MLAASEMDVVEQVDPGSLPSTTTEQGFVKGTQKLAQIGQVGWDSIMSSLMDGSNLSNRSVILIADLTVLWGHALKSFIAKEPVSKAEFYLGFHTSEEYQEWCDIMLTEWMVKGLQNKSISIPGHEWRDMSPPAEHLEAAPARPQLTRLAWNSMSADSESEVYPVIKEEDIRKWAHHPDFGSEFREIMDQHVVECQAGNIQPLKRKGSQFENLLSPPKKKPKHVGEEMDCGSVVAINMVPGVEILSVPMVSIKVAKDSESPKLSLRTDKEIYVVNVSGQDVTVKHGDMMAGMGKITFRQLKEGQAPYDPEHDVKFSVQGHSDLTLLNNQLVTYGEVLKQWASAHDKTFEQCKIAYHKLLQDVGEPWSFTTEMTHQVVARKSVDANQPVTQVNVGNRLEPFFGKANIISFYG